MLKGIWKVGISMVAMVAMMDGCTSKAEYDRNAAVLADSIIVFGERALEHSALHMEQYTSDGHEDGRHISPMQHAVHGPEDAMLIRDKAWIDSALHTLMDPPSARMSAHGKLMEMHATYVELQRQALLHDASFRTYAGAIQELRSRLVRINGELRILLDTE